jgi:WD40 repeat protein
MTFEDAQASVLSHLRARGKATNYDLIDLLGGDESLFQRIRQTLILDDLAEDYKGAGLVYTGFGEENPEIETDRDERSPEPSVASKEGQGKATPDGQPQKVFLSYGRKDAAGLAQRLKEALEADGHTVWMDQGEIHSGRPWEGQIEQAIDGADLTVAVLSPHAVRRPEGVCLDEISYARYGGTPIVPVMAISCTPPLGIYRLDWVDMQGWDRQTGRFERALGKLQDALRRGPNSLSVEGTHADLFGQLQPLDFGPELSRLQHGFTGRGWVVDAVEAWLSDPAGAPAFLLTGDPGAGKSAVMAHLAQTLPQVAALHFCRADNSQTLRADAFVRSVAAQLATQLPGYAEALRGVLAQPNALDEEPDALFKNLIINPLAAAQAGDGPLLLLVDGLDEAVQHRAQTGPSIPRLVGSFLGELATMTGRVRLVLSSRPVPGVLQHVQGRSKPLALQASAPENRADLEAFVSERLERIRGALKKAGTGAQAVTAWLTGRAGGNFLYAEQALLGIESGRLDPSEPDAFPAGLVGLYASQFERLFPGPNGTASYDTELRPLLSVLVAAREPLSAGQVAKALGASGQADAAHLDPMDPAFTVRRRMKQVAAQYPKRDGRYVPFHASVTEWLSGETGHAATDAMTYAVSLKAGHRMLAAAGQAAWDDDGADSPPYVLRHLPGHLLDAGQWEEAHDLLTTLAYVEAKAQAGYARGLAEDFKAAAETAPRGRRAESRILRVLGRAIEHEMGFLRRHPECLFQVCWNRGWWTDAKEAKHYFEVDESAAEGYQPPWALEGPKVSGLLERWRRERATVPWVRRALPPRDLFASVQTVLRGHEDDVIHVAWSPSGDRLASASGEPHGNDNTVRVWGLTGQAGPLVLRGHRCRVTRVAWSPSGDRLASASYDGTVRVWDPTGQAEPLVLRGHEGTVNHVAWSPSGDRLASASDDYDGIVRVWDPTGLAEPVILRGHESFVNHVAWSPSGERLASASDDGTVRVWDPTGEAEPLVLRGHEGTVNHVAWSPSGERLASASDDGTVRVWAPTGPAEPLVLRGHEKAVKRVAWSPSGERLASASWGDRTVRVWDATGEAEPLVLRGHEGTVTHVAWSPSGERLASASWGDRTVRVWDPTGPAEPLVLRGHEDNVMSLAWSPSGEHLASASWDKTVRVWDLTGQADPVVPRGHEDDIEHVAWSPSGGRLASVSYDGTVRVWDPTSQADPIVLRGAGLDLRGDRRRGVIQKYWSPPAWSPSGERLAIASKDGTMRVWDPTGQTEPLVLKESSGFDLVDWFEHMAWSPSGERLATASEDGTMRVWDPTGQAEPLVLHGHEDKVRSLAWSPSGDRLASASSDDTVRVWDPTGRAASLVLRGHESWVTHVAWSPSGGRLASASQDGTVRMWDSQTGAELDCFKGRTIPESFYRVSETRSPYVSRALPTETRIEHRRGETPVAWLEVSGYEGLTSSPSGAPVWAARSGPSLLVFEFEDPPD